MPNIHDAFDHDRETVCDFMRDGSEHRPQQHKNLYFASEFGGNNGLSLKIGEYRPDIDRIVLQSGEVHDWGKLGETYWIGAELCFGCPDSYSWPPSNEHLHELLVFVDGEFQICDGAVQSVKTNTATGAFDPHSIHHDLQFVTDLSPPTPIRDSFVQSQVGPMDLPRGQKVVGNTEIVAYKQKGKLSPETETNTNSSNVQPEHEYKSTDVTIVLENPNEDTMRCVYCGSGDVERHQPEDEDVVYHCQSCPATFPPDMGEHLDPEFEDPDTGEFPHPRSLRADLNYALEKLRRVEGKCDITESERTADAARMSEIRDDLRDSIESLEQHVDDHRDCIANTQKDIANLKDEISTIKGRVEAKADATESEFRHEAANLANRIGELEEKSSEKQHDIRVLRDRVSKIRQNTLTEDDVVEIMVEALEAGVDVLTSMFETLVTCRDVADAVLETMQSEGDDE